MREVRVLLKDQQSSKPFSIWMVKEDSEDNTVQFTLRHSYPDMKPAPGWLVEHDGKTFVVRQVAGLTLVCEQ